MQNRGLGCLFRTSLRCRTPESAHRGPLVLSGRPMGEESAKRISEAPHLPQEESVPRSREDVAGVAALVHGAVFSSTPRIT